MRNLPADPLLPPTPWRRGLARAATAGALLLACQLPAQANWSASVNTQTLDLGLYASSWSGSFSWTTLQEGWGTTYNTNGTIPNDFTFQSWDGSNWPQASFGGSVNLPGGAQASAQWFHDDTQVEADKTGSASVIGPMSGGLSSGAFLLHDFRLVVAPFSTVEISYYGDNHAIDLSHDAGDEGVAFGYVKLFDHTLGLDSVGGANQPYFQGLQSLSGGSEAASLSDTTGDHSHSFINNTGVAQTYDLRFEAAVLVFTTPPVPEPQTWVLWLAGLGLLGAARRAAGRTLGG